VVVVGESTEYCQFEQFNATCSIGYVILVDEARYGRMHLGRCVTKDYGYIGCSTDVLDIFDRVCSGRRWCLVGVALLRDVVNPCPADLTGYLEASYRCLASELSSFSLQAKFSRFSVSFL